MVLLVGVTIAFTLSSVAPRESVALVQQATAVPSRTALVALGGTAPPLSVAQWLQGAPIGALEPGTVYVLDFSAPWCAPCVAALPHLSMLQDRFAAQGVRVVAIFGPDSAGTSAAQVAGLLQAAGQPPSVSVAYDAHADRGEPALDTFYGITAAAYLEGAGLDGIPAAFVVDRRGRVAWIGAPAQVAGVVEQVLAGTWDVDSARARYQGARAADERLLRFRADLNIGRVASAMAEARQLVDGPYADDSGSLRVISAAITAAAQAGVAGVDTDLALRAILLAEKLTGGADGAVLTTLARLRFLRREVAEAIETQQRAMLISPAAQRPMLQQALDEYVRAKDLR